MNRILWLDLGADGPIVKPFSPGRRWERRSKRCCGFHSQPRAARANIVQLNLCELAQDSLEVFPATADEKQVTLIVEESLPHMFDRFYKADPSYMDSGSGPGLSTA